MVMLWKIVPLKRRIGFKYVNGSSISDVCREHYARLLIVYDGKVKETVLIAILFKTVETYFNEVSWQ